MVTAVQNIVQNHSHHEAACEGVVTHRLSVASWSHTTLTSLHGTGHRVQIPKENLLVIARLTIFKLKIESRIARYLVNMHGEHLRML